MDSRRVTGCAALVLAGVVAAPRGGFAGPPYLTDDPEPVEHRHWELYLASQTQHDTSGWSGTGPHVEVNYGPLPDVHLHVIAPMAFAAPEGGAGSTYGYGDTEVGVKLRLVHETDNALMVGTFPLVLLPTGDTQRALGTGHPQVYLPLWVQKAWGGWSTYGGGGYWVAPGAMDLNHWFFGWQVQRRLGEHLAVGAEVFCTTPTGTDHGLESGWNIGTVIDLNDTQHILLSAGGRYRTDLQFQGYVAWQVTLGPGE